MIKHIVCFKLAEPSERACWRAKEVLLSMIGNVPTIRSIEVGLDFLHSPRSYDIMLAVTVDDKAALDEYANDPYHCGVVKTHMHAVCASSVTVDFEM
ncbi:MAG: Dabb family protein [Clostridia bacterium]|nr:Dabb family protein [Clostridia bacterium]